MHCISLANRSHLSQFICLHLAQFDLSVLTCRQTPNQSIVITRSHLLPTTSPTYNFIEGIIYSFLFHQILVQYIDHAYWFICDVS